MLLDCAVEATPCVGCLSIAIISMGLDTANNEVCARRQDEYIGGQRGRTAVWRRREGSDVSISTGDGIARNSEAAPGDRQRNDYTDRRASR